MSWLALPLSKLVVLCTGLLVDAISPHLPVVFLEGRGLVATVPVLGLAELEALDPALSGALTIEGEDPNAVAGELNQRLDQGPLLTILDGERERDQWRGGIRAEAAVLFSRAQNVRGALAQLRALEQSTPIRKVQLAQLWVECLRELQPPKKSKQGTVERHALFFREFVRFAKRYRVSGDPHGRVVRLTEGVSSKLVLTPKALARALETLDMRSVEENAPGLLARFWRGSRGQLSKRLKGRGGKLFASRACDYDHGEEDGTLHFGSRRIRELGEPGRGPLVGRMNGVIDLGEPGVYRLDIRADDAVRAWVGSSCILNTWDQTNAEGGGEYWWKWHRREVWVDGRAEIAFDTWDIGGQYSFWLAVYRMQADGSWRRVSFQASHDA